MRESSIQSSSSLSPRRARTPRSPKKAYEGEPAVWRMSHHHPALRLGVGVGVGVPQGDDVNAVDDAYAEEEDTPALVARYGAVLMDTSELGTADGAHDAPRRPQHAPRSWSHDDYSFVPKMVPTTKGERRVIGNPLLHRPEAAVVEGGEGAAATIGAKGTHQLSRRQPSSPSPSPSPARASSSSHSPQASTAATKSSSSSTSTSSNIGRSPLVVPPRPTTIYRRSPSVEQHAPALPAMGSHSVGAGADGRGSAAHRRDPLTDTSLLDDQHHAPTARPSPSPSRGQRGRGATVLAAPKEEEDSAAKNAIHSPHRSRSRESGHHRRAPSPPSAVASNANLSMDEEGHDDEGDVENYYAHPTRRRGGGGGSPPSNAHHHHEDPSSLFEVSTSTNYTARGGGGGGARRGQAGDTERERGGVFVWADSRKGRLATSRTASESVKRRAASTTAAAARTSTPTSKDPSPQEVVAAGILLEAAQGAHSTPRMARAAALRAMGSPAAAGLFGGTADVKPSSVAPPPPPQRKRMTNLHTIDLSGVSSSVLTAATSALGHGKAPLDRALTHPYHRADAYRGAGGGRSASGGGAKGLPSSSALMPLVGVAPDVSEYVRTLDACSDDLIRLKRLELQEKDRERELAKRLRREVLDTYTRVCRADGRRRTRSTQKSRPSSGGNGGSSIGAVAGPSLNGSVDIGVQCSDDDDAEGDGAWADGAHSSDHSSHHHAHGGSSGVGHYGRHCRNGLSSASDESHSSANNSALVIAPTPAAGGAIPQRSMPPTPSSRAAPNASGTTCTPSARPLKGRTPSRTPSPPVRTVTITLREGAGKGVVPPLHSGTPRQKAANTTAGPSDGRADPEEGALANEGPPVVATQPPASPSLAPCANDHSVSSVPCLPKTIGNDVWRVSLRAPRPLLGQAQQQQQQGVAAGAVRGSGSARSSSNGSRAPSPVLHDGPSFESDDDGPQITRDNRSEHYVHSKAVKDVERSYHRIGGVVYPIPGDTIGATPHIRRWSSPRTSHAATPRGGRVGAIRRDDDGDATEAFLQFVSGGLRAPRSAPYQRHSELDGKGLIVGPLVPNAALEERVRMRTLRLCFGVMRRAAQHRIMAAKARSLALRRCFGLWHDKAHHATAMAAAAEAFRKRRLCSPVLAVMRQRMLMTAAVEYAKQRAVTSCLALWRSRAAVGRRRVACQEGRDGELVRSCFARWRHRCAEEQRVVRFQQEKYFGRWRRRYGICQFAKRLSNAVDLNREREEKPRLLRLFFTAWRRAFTDHRREMWETDADILSKRYAIARREATKRRLLSRWRERVHGRRHYQLGDAHRSFSLLQKAWFGWRAAFQQRSLRRSVGQLRPTTMVVGSGIHGHLRSTSPSSSSPLAYRSHGGGGGVVGSPSLYTRKAHRQPSPSARSSSGDRGGGGGGSVLANVLVALQDRRGVGGVASDGGASPGVRGGGAYAPSTLSSPAAIQQTTLIGSNSRRSGSANRHDIAPSSSSPLTSIYSADSLRGRRRSSSPDASPYSYTPRQSSIVTEAPPTRTITPPHRQRSVRFAPPPPSSSVPPPSSSSAFTNAQRFF